MSADTRDMLDCLNKILQREKGLAVVYVAWCSPDPRYGQRKLVVHKTSSLGDFLTLLEYAKHPSFYGDHQPVFMLNDGSWVCMTYEFFWELHFPFGTMAFPWNSYPRIALEDLKEE